MARFGSEPVKKRSSKERRDLSEVAEGSDDSHTKLAPYRLLA